MGRIVQAMTARWLVWRSLAVMAGAADAVVEGDDASASGRRGGRDRGDVPGWVMVTVMTAALVVAIATLATPALQNLFTSAIDSVSGVAAVAATDAATASSVVAVLEGPAEVIGVTDVGGVPKLTGDGGAADPGVGGDDDSGSAIVEFILVGTLLLFLFLGILQVGLVLHIRNTLAADAAEGARHAANLGVPASEGGPYAQALIARSIPGRADTVCTGTEVAGPGGTPLVEVTCEVAVPLVLVPLGDGVTIRVTGHALKELP